MKKAILLFGFTLVSFLFLSQTEHINNLQSIFDSVGNTVLKLKNKDQLILNKMLETLKTSSINNRLNKYTNSEVRIDVLYNNENKSIKIREYYDEDFICFINGYNENDLYELSSFYEDEWLYAESDFEKYKMSLGIKNKKTKKALKVSQKYEDSMNYFNQLINFPKVYKGDRIYESCKIDTLYGVEVIDTIHPYFIVTGGIYDSNYTEFISKKSKSNFYLLSISLREKSKYKIGIPYLSEKGEIKHNKGVVIRNESF